MSACVLWYVPCGDTGLSKRGSPLGPGCSSWCLPAVVQVNVLLELGPDLFCSCDDHVVCVWRPTVPQPVARVDTRPMMPLPARILRARALQSRYLLLVAGKAFFVLAPLSCAANAGVGAPSFELQCLDAHGEGVALTHAMWLPTDASSRAMKPGGHVVSCAEDGMCRKCVRERHTPLCTCDMHSPGHSRQRGKYSTEKCPTRPTDRACFEARQSKTGLQPATG